MPLFIGNPLEQPGYWDVCVAAGVTSPGVAKLTSGGGREYNWDIKQAPGTQGYLMTYRGWKAGEDITFRFTFFEHPDGPGYKESLPGPFGGPSSLVQQFYEEWVPLFALDARKLRPTPVAFYHPTLAANDIDQVVCKRIGPLETDGNMNWWVDMTFIEFRPPRIIPTSTPSGATARLGVPTVNDKLDAAIADERVLAARPL